MTPSVGAPAGGDYAKEKDLNLRVYNQSEVVAHYASLGYITPCEKTVFDKFIKPGGAILDLGVGGGRTTPYLSGLASRYVGVDYAPEMLAACRRKFPRHEFLLADATNLAAFADRSFDTVVMAFNGMDYLDSNQLRRRCLAEVYRLLRKNGVVIFSSHNPRAVFSRPCWNRDRLETLVVRMAGKTNWVRRPLGIILLALRVAVALVQSLTDSTLRLVRRLPRRAFWSGDGYLIDPAHGGLLTHYAVPERVIAEAKAEGFNFLRCTGSDYPKRSATYVTDWYYYVFQKDESTASARCA